MQPAEFSRILISESWPDPSVLGGYEEEASSIAFAELGVEHEDCNRSRRQYSLRLH